MMNTVNQIGFEEVKMLCINFWKLCYKKWNIATKRRKNHFNKRMLFTSEDDQKFRSATKCHICEHDFVKGDKVVRDHDHVTSAFRGAAH